MNSKHLQTIAHALVLVAIMLGLIAAALWFRLDSGWHGNEARARLLTRSALAATEDTGIPDAGKQGQLMLEQFDLLNRRLADIERGLRDGLFTIRTLEPKGAAGQPGKTGATEGKEGES
jgi:hypothetical protein